VPVHDQPLLDAHGVRSAGDQRLDPALDRGVEAGERHQALDVADAIGFLRVDMIAVSTSSQALPQPISRGSTDASMPDGMPWRVSGMPNFAWSAATRMSAQAASSMP